MRITQTKLRQIIREEAQSSGFTWSGDEDPRITPPEREFVNGPDAPAGYIVVRDKHEHSDIAWAPIVRTDGPDRPFLVRTTDTHWEIPHWIVELIYPRVEDAFNDVDSREDWRDLGPGSKGERKGLEWEWVDSQPMSESAAPGTVRLSGRQIRMLVETKVGSGNSDPKASRKDFEKTQASLRKLLASEISIDALENLKSTDPVYKEIINKALDSVGITDKTVREDICSDLLKMIPVDIAGLPRT